MFVKNNHNLWLDDVEILFIEEHLCSIKHKIYKSFHWINKYTKKYPNPNKPNCWFLEYDDLNFDRSSHDFVKNLHVLKALSKEKDILVLRITSPGGPITEFAEIYSLIKDLKVN